MLSTSCLLIVTWLIVQSIANAVIVRVCSEPEETRIRERLRVAVATTTGVTLGLFLLFDLAVSQSATFDKSQCPNARLQRLPPDRALSGQTKPLQGGNTLQGDG